MFLFVLLAYHPDSILVRLKPITGCENQAFVSYTSRAVYVGTLVFCQQLQNSKVENLKWIPFTVEEFPVDTIINELSGSYYHFI